jgi:hypothetical protein
MRRIRIARKAARLTRDGLQRSVPRTVHAAAGGIGGTGCERSGACKG